MTQVQKKIKYLVNRCLVITDQCGEVLQKEGHPFSTSLSMRYECEGISIVFSVQCSPYSNGSCSVKVTEGDRVVFEAEGNYTASPFNVVARTYEPGPWEKLVG